MIKKQKSTLVKKEEVQRNWVLVDLEGKVLGRAATQIADILRGKNKVTYTPHADTGDFVVAINAQKIKLTGKKPTDKIYYHHTGYIGNMKKVKAGTLMKEKPEKAMTLAIKGMLPDNTIGRKSLTRLRVYSGVDHENAAQKPEVFEF